MGKVLKILSETHIDPGLYYKSARVESAESIHFHWRNIRLVLRDKNFEILTHCINRASEEWENTKREKGQGNGIILSDFNISEDAINKLTVELVENGIHIHFKDLRLEFSQEQFMQFSKGIIEAVGNLEISNQQSRENNF